MNPWWREAVVYQVYPRSFADSDGDGIGDLRGVRSRLDHLEWLGADALWLNPTTPSPNADWGYDVADYYGVEPDLGTLDDLDGLVADAAARGIRVLLDLVPNHTSDRHPWFAESRSGRDSARRDWYVWADAPNNWLSAFGGPAWTLDERTSQHYLHAFLPEQPDLNWWNEEVREEFDRILRFWLDRGVAGFRIDCAHRIVKDELLRDNLPLTDSDHVHTHGLGQQQTYTASQPGVHEVLRRWRRLCDGYPSQPVLLGEAYVLELDRFAAYYGAELDELHLAFVFPLLHAAFDAEELAAVVAETEAALPAGAWPAWAGSNHDGGRLATRWCDGDEARARCALLALLTLRGTPTLYYGDEIALEEVEVPPERMLDPVGKRGRRGRDGCRTPMLWDASPGAGFTAAPERAWLPLGDSRERNVAAQLADPGSTLHLCRDLIRLRRAEPDLRSGDSAPLPAPAGAWAWRRGEGHAAAINLSDASVHLDGVGGTVAIGTDRGRDGERVARRLQLGAWEGAVVALG